MEEEKKYWNSVQNKINKFLPYDKKSISNLLPNIYQLHTNIFKNAEARITHNDFQASNIIYDRKSKDIGIIDFGATQIFNSTIDVATYMVHLAVMTNKHMSIKKTIDLQKRFLRGYLKNIPKKLHDKTIKELPLYQARTAADIIATTAVALTHTKNPYRKIIPKLLIPVVEEKLRQNGVKTRPISSLMVQLKKYHET